jgi:hypothetical protein
VKNFENGLKPEIYRDEIYSSAYENLRVVINEARDELAAYREVLKITDHMKKSNVKKSPVSTATTDGKKSEKPGKSITVHLRCFIKGNISHEVQRCKGRRVLPLPSERALCKQMSGLEPVGGWEVSLVGNHSLHVLGNKVRMQMDVGRRGSVQEFLILDKNSEK